MSQMTIILSQETSGWFVTAHNKLGPYVCREQANNLASGMVDAIRATGGDAELIVLEKQMLRRARSVSCTAEVTSLALADGSGPSAFGPNPFAPAEALPADTPNPCGPRMA